MWLFISLASSVASARDVAKTPQTFTVDTNLSTGAVENFREVYVDPSTLASVAPAQAGAGEPGILVIRNDALSWTEVSVSGTKIGIIGALKDGRLQGVRPGAYDVSLSYPNGHVQNVRLATAGFTPAEAPPAAPRATATTAAPEASETPKAKATAE